jgi:ring-1,2-phenylacetyl-CoA epoxidase subunit PaaE
LQKKYCYNITKKLKVFTLKVVEVRTETSDTVTVAFKQPGLKKIKYLPGQYLTLIFRINGRRYIRPYSFSSAPIVDENLEITVKRVPGGVVSNHIIDKLNIDDIIEVMEPMGDFTLDENKITPETHIVLWGAGSGVTPLISIAKYALNKNIGVHVTLVYGNRNTDEVIFNEKILQLKKQFQGQFSGWHFYSQLTITPNNPRIIQGRINPELVLAIMAKEGDLAKTIHYICGPAGLKESVKTSLKLLGVADGKVFSEDFEVVRDPSEFESIVTRMVSLSFNGEKTLIEVVKGKSILEAGLDANLDMPYSCQTGNCLVCKGRLIRGDVKLIGVDKLPDKLNVNEHLLCSTFPLSDNIEIEVE